MKTVDNVNLKHLQYEQTNKINKNRNYYKKVAVNLVYQI